MTTNTQTLLLLPGDGIGPEVTEEARRVAVHVAPDLQIESAFFGGVSYDQFGTPLTEEVMNSARRADAILMGAVGGPQWDSVPRDKRPEAALLAMRKNLDVYANLRPAFCFPALAGAKPDETVVFAYIVFSSREHRDAVNAKVMADPRLQEMCNPATPSFDFHRMAYGGFKVIVQA